MRKLLFLLAMLPMLLLASCSSDDDKDEPQNMIDYSVILGTWAEISSTEGEYVSGKVEYSWTFRSDKTATQRLVMYINGIKTKESSADLTYVYNGKEIITKDSSGKETVHEVSVNGNTMRFGDGAGDYFNLVRQ